ncbi:MAG: hypothetical protein KGL39_57100 [Patescibacteria group bacterium]|nr:hypothetical protein [Patescibacteria group bacterium]
MSDNDNRIDNDDLRTVTGNGYSSIKTEELEQLRADLRAAQERIEGLNRRVEELRKDSEILDRIEKLAVWDARWDTKTWIVKHQGKRGTDSTLRVTLRQIYTDLIDRALADSAGKET